MSLHMGRCISTELLKCPDLLHYETTGSRVHRLDPLQVQTLVFLTQVQLEPRLLSYHPILMQSDRGARGK